MFAGGVEGHRGLGVVPGVEVPAAEPRDGSVGLLVGEDRADGGGGLGGVEDAVQQQRLRDGGRHSPVRGLEAYTTKDLPMTGLRAFSAALVILLITGVPTMSQTSSWW